MKTVVINFDVYQLLGCQHLGSGFYQCANTHHNRTLLTHAGKSWNISTEINPGFENTIVINFEL